MKPTQSRRGGQPYISSLAGFNSGQWLPKLWAIDRRRAFIILAHSNHLEPNTTLPNTLTLKGEFLPCYSNSKSSRRHNAPGEDSLVLAVFSPSMSPSNITIRLWNRQRQIWRLRKSVWKTISINHGIAWSGWQYGLVVADRSWYGKYNAHQWMVLKGVVVQGKFWELM